MTDPLRDAYEADYLEACAEYDETAFRTYECTVMAMCQEDD